MKKKIPFSKLNGSGNRITSYNVCYTKLLRLETLRAPGFLEDVRRKGEILREGLLAIAAGRKDVREVRGAGLILAMEMERETKEIAVRCLENGLVVNATAGNVLRFLPPLTISGEEIRKGLRILAGSLPAEGGR